MTNKIPTGKRHRWGQPATFDVNTKLAVGKYFVLVSRLLQQVWQHAMPHTRRIAAVRHIYTRCNTLSVAGWLGSATKIYRATQQLSDID